MTLSQNPQSLLYPMGTLHQPSHCCFIKRHQTPPSPIEEEQDIAPSALDFDLGFDPPLLYSKDYAVFPLPHEVNGPLLESVYPSPPSTSSEPKQSVPLPGLTAQPWASGNLESWPPFLQPGFFGGVLDSPLVMQHASLKAHTPISPPPTQPTSTLALPPTDNELTSIDEGSASCYFQPECSYQASPSTHIVEPPPSHFIDPLLSPLSPEWRANTIPSMPSPKASQEFYLLSHDSALPEHTSLDSLSFHRGSDGFSSFDDEDDLMSTSSSSSLSASTSGSRPILSLLNIPPSASSSSATTYTSSPTSLCQWDHDDLTSPVSIISEIEGDDEFIDSPPSPGPPQTPSSSQSGFHDLISEPSKDSFDSAAYQYFPHPSSPSIRSLQWLPDLDDDDIPSPSPSSPTLRSFTSLPELGRHHPNYILDEYDFQDEDEHMHSPTRSILSLPGASTDDDLLPSLGFRTSLPDTDSFMLPSYAPLPSPQSPTSSLLLLLDEDPNDVLPPRSPSPENFTLDPSLVAELPESSEVQKLSELRKKAQQAEKAAKQKEHAALMGMVAEDGGWSVQKAAEARKLAKREREKAKEVSALLRLKLGERGVNVLGGGGGRMRSSPSSDIVLGLNGGEGDSTMMEAVLPSETGKDPSPLPPPPSPLSKTTALATQNPTSSTSKKPKINNIAQLVAKMIFSRHDASSGRPPSKYRPLWLRGIQQHQQFLRSSPLARNAAFMPRVGQHTSDIDSGDREFGGRGGEVESEPKGWAALRLQSFDMDVDPVDGDDDMDFLPAL